MEMSVKDFFNLIFRFSFNDVRRWLGMIRGFGVFVIRENLRDIPDRVNILPVGRKLEMIGMSANLFYDFKRSRISFHKFPGGSIESKV